MDRAHSPFYYLQMCINFPLIIASLLFPPFLYFVYQIFLYIPENHIAEQPRPKFRIPLGEIFPGKVGTILIYAFCTAAPAHRVGDEGAAGDCPRHYPGSALLPACFVHQQWRDVVF